MNVLGIETATAVCGTAVYTNGRIAAFEEHNVPNIHAERLLPSIERVLKQAGITATDLDAVAVSIGPGSFTGLRIGLSVGKGIVFTTKAKLVSVSTLEALAYRVVDSGTTASGRILAALDARRDRVYCQVFKCDAGNMKPETDIRLMPVAEIAGEVGQDHLTLVGNGTPFLVTAAQALDAGKRWQKAPDEINRASAVTVALLGFRQFAKGAFENISTAEPAYITDFFEKR